MVALSMLYIKRYLLILILSVHAGMSATELRFNANTDGQLPESAEIFTHVKGIATVEVSQNRLRLSLGGGTNSARAAVAFPPTDGTGGGKSRELKLEFEPFTGSGDEGGRAGLWAGFISAPLGAQSTNTAAGSWVGVVIEMKESKDGLCMVVLNQRWEIDESGEARLAHGLSNDCSREFICELAECPTTVELDLKDGKIRVSFTGSDLQSVAPNAQAMPGGTGVEIALQREMQDVLKGNLEAAFGLANYGDVTEAPVLLIKSFSVRQ